MVQPTESTTKRRRVELYPYPQIPQESQDSQDNMAGEYKSPFKLRLAPKRDGHISFMARPFDQLPNWQAGVIGTITRFYGRWIAVRPYPAGYTHNLSLITDEALVEMVSPPGYPRVTGWEDYTAALEQKKVYTVCHQSNIHKGRCIEGTADGTLFKRATVIGTGYTWDKILRTQNAFLLWHTGKISPVNGWSGSPLCLGCPHDATAKAVVFQNLQRWCRVGTSGQEALIKGGFVLPSETRKSEIESADGNVSRKFPTSPMRGRSSNESYRRIVSGGVIICGTGVATSPGQGRLQTTPVCHEIIVASTIT
ncbi:hypothetical protein BO71DRAFT_427490 [Aspergillus ellipticus CBS 707.79]|uniref:Uncharacterized protein n=1 Tax=Aspergillus ellipticus CBS 707.79 TaxID=1448320 RepID=A0A319DSR5_9EURO|nr:hypothetical protein BO71DRAFT_427490 [Aspergillus ellipticus CBS 707.79]